MFPILKHKFLFLVTHLASAGILAHWLGGSDVLQCWALIKLTTGGCIIVLFSSLILIRHLIQYKVRSSEQTRSQFFGGPKDPEARSRIKHKWMASCRGHFWLLDGWCWSSCCSYTMMRINGSSLDAGAFGRWWKMCDFRWFRTITDFVKLDTIG